MSLEIAGEVQLRTYGQFLDEYGTQLRGIEEALEDSMCVSWDMNLDPISLQVIYGFLFIYLFFYFYFILFFMFYYWSFSMQNCLPSSVHF